MSWSQSHTGIPIYSTRYQSKVKINQRGVSILLEYSCVCPEGTIHHHISQLQCFLDQLRFTCHWSKFDCSCAFTNRWEYSSVPMRVELITAPSGVFNTFVQPQVTTRHESPIWQIFCSNRHIFSQPPKSVERKVSLSGISHREPIRPADVVPASQLPISVNLDFPSKKHRLLIRQDAMAWRSTERKG